MKKILFILSIISLSINYVFSDVLYWVDSKTIDPSYNQDNSRNALDVTESITGNYNWATGFTLTDGVPTYTYANPVITPTAETDVYFSYKNCTYKNAMAGAININNEFSVKSITIESCTNNWLMFSTNGHNFNVAGDITYADSNTVVAYFGNNASNVKIGGDVITQKNSTSYWNALRLGQNRLSYLELNNIRFEKAGRIQIDAGKTETTIDAPHALIKGTVEFGSNNGRLDIVRTSSSFESIIQLGGINGTNGTVTTEGSTGDERAANGAVANLVFANKTNASFSGVVSEIHTVVTSNSIQYNVDTTINLIMRGSARQLLSGDNAISGYVMVDSGTLLMRTASGKSTDALILNGGAFGAGVDKTSNAGTFSTGIFEWNNSAKLIVTIDTLGIASLIDIAQDMIKSSNSIANKKYTIAFEGNTSILREGDSLKIMQVAGINDFTSEDLITDTFQNSLGETLQGDIRINEDGSIYLDIVSAIPEPSTTAFIFAFITLSLVFLKRRIS